MKRNMSAGIVSATIIAIAVILFSIHNFSNTLEKDFTSDIYNRLSELSINNAASIHLKISDQLEMMHALAANLAAEDLRGEKARTMMDKTVESYGFLRGAITFPDGSFVTNDNKNEGNVSGNDYVIQGFQGISCVTGPMDAVVDSTKTVILLTVPIYQGPQIIALYTCTYETKYLENIFQMTSFEGQGYSYITAADGSIISRPQINDLIYDGDNIMTFFKEQLADSYAEMSQNIQNMKSGTVLLTIGGRQKYINYQPLGINQWYVFSVTSGEVLDDQLNGMLNGVYALSVVIIATLLLLVFFAWLYIHTIQKKSKAELQKLAYYDSLTGIPNRNFFEKEARIILDTAPSKYAYIILNVNKFKLVNDIFGFSEGDRLLQHIANTLCREVRKEEISARFDTDNFHILSVYTGKETLEQRMMDVAGAITDYRFDKNIPHTLSVGFGVYLIEEKAMSIGGMGDKARMALSKIKGFHSPTTYFYNNEIIRQFMEEQEIENSMQSALTKGEMKLYLQPKCSTVTHQVHSAEALVRWENPARGLVMPDCFIPLFEKNGFIIQLDLYMVDSACKKLREWHDKNMRIIPISVNQSRACLYQPNYIQELLKILSKYDIAPALIELEITERAFFDDESALIQIIEQLHMFGFKVAMDDFGVGYSSLNMLQDVLVDVLKIDKNFFRESINSERGKKIVSNIVAMANDLDIEVVAEGIETKEQLDFLKAIHCGSVQGFYFSKPISAELFELAYCNPSQIPLPHAQRD